MTDTRAGNERGKSSSNEFILVKTQTFINFYRGLQQRKPKHILEVGMFEGGSLVLFDKLYKPERLVGIDIRDAIPALEQYRKGRKHIRTFYKQSQDDPKLTGILEKQFPDGIDLIVDDASHLYEQSRKTFDLCFPLLKPGGLYVLEDWSWSHKQTSQLDGHPWKARPALTNLVFELVVNMPDSQQMSRVVIQRDIVLIEKAMVAKGNIDLNVGLAKLRGKALPQL